MVQLMIGGAGLAALLLIAQPAHAQADTIVVSGSPSSMTINTATPGVGLASNTVATTTYSIMTATQVPLKIKARISSGGEMPANTSLTLTIEAPGGGGTSAGAKALTTSDQDFVTGITAQNSSGRTITYVLSATVAGAPFSSTSRTITFTIGP